MGKGISAVAMPCMGSLGSPVAWFDRFERRNGILTPVGLGEDGTEHALSVEELQGQTASTSSLCVRAILDLDAAQPGALSSYRHHLPEQATNGHQVFGYLVHGWTLLLPALTLIQAAFRPFKVLAPYLYSPCGFDAVCIPADETCERIHWVMPITRGLQGAAETHEASLGWAWGYPSGRALWDSAYHYAKQGVVGADPPCARVEIVAYVARIGKELLASRCSFVTLEPREAPFAFCERGASNRRVLHKLPRTLLLRRLPILDLRASPHTRV